VSGKGRARVPVNWLTGMTSKHCHQKPKDITNSSHSPQELTVLHDLGPVSWCSDQWRTNAVSK
jgi:hypothetical protein